MDPSALPAPEAGRTLWLVRHGESTWNALGLVQGQIGEPALTLLGLDQARQAAAALAAAPVRTVYSSDLQRATQTARPIGAALGLSVTEDPALRERCFGVAEGTPSRWLAAQDSGIDGERVVDVDAAPSGGESIRALYWRAAGFVEQLLSASPDLERPAGDVVLVAHGGVVRVLLAWFDGIEPDRMGWAPVGNGLVVGRPLAAARRAPVPVT
jgi:probable phosphoglycerate mutase